MKATAAKNQAYKDTLQSIATRSARERYREKRREEKRLHRRKKREAEIRELEDIEMYCSRNQARKFYERIKRQTEGLKPGANACNDENGNLVTDVQGFLRLWRDHFSGLLNGDEDTHHIHIAYTSCCAKYGRTNVCPAIGTLAYFAQSTKREIPRSVETIVGSVS